MKVKLVGSSVGDGPARQFLTSYLIDDTLAIDAGSVGFMSSLDAQRRINAVFLSHAHMDHVASLPMLLDNVFRPGHDCVVVYGSATVLDCLRHDLFNDRIWPDLQQLGDDEHTFIKLVELHDHQSVSCSRLNITPVPLDHAVPTHGFLVDDGECSIAIASDTRATHAIWQVLSRQANLRAVFLEASFPNSLTWLAEQSGHLTPAQFAEEAKKLEADVEWLAVHIKANHQAEVAAELQALGMDRLQIAEADREYKFS